MKNLKNLLVALGAGLLILTSACDKKEDVAPVTLLTKLTYVNPDGTKDERNYEYNSQNKLAKLKFTYDTTAYETQITYDVDGKISQVLTLQNGIETYKNIYTWTTNSFTGVEWSKYENDDWVESSYKSIYDLNSDGLITKNQSFYKQDTNWIGSTYELFTWTNGNMEKEEMWNIENRKSNAFKHFNQLHGINLIAPGLKSAYDTKFRTATFEFDDKNNAFLSLGFVGGTYGSNKNNITKATYSYLDQNVIIYSYSYEYDSKNYPTKMTEEWTNYEGVSETAVILFEYTTK